MRDMAPLKTLLIILLVLAFVVAVDFLVDAYRAKSTASQPEP